MSSPVNINNSFFNGINKDVWKKINPPGLTDAEVDFIYSAASLSPGHRVLDLMCGYGRHALALGRKGVKVTAVDNQEEYINEINAAASAGELPVLGYHSDVLNYSPEGSFEAALCMGNSFAFFNREESTSLARTISNAIVPSGVLIINSWMIAEIAIRHFREKDWFYAGDFKYILDYRFCFSPNRIESEQTVISPQGEIETNDAVDYIFSLNELEEIFSSAGMRIRDLYATPRKKKFSLGDSQVYMVIEKSAH